MQTLIDKIAADLGVGPEARKKWRQRGVAHRWRLKIMSAALERGIKLDPSAFEPATKRGEAA